MTRAFLLAAAAAPLLVAARAPAAVDYRVALAPAGVTVEMRLRGEADGDTRLAVPQAAAASLRVSGATVTSTGAEWTLRHKPGARLRVRYALPGGGEAVSGLGENLFAAPVGWDAAPAAVRWRKAPKGWSIRSDLEHAAEGRLLTVADVRRSVFLAGAQLQTAERAIAGGVVRGVTYRDDRWGAEKLVTVTAPAVAAMRAYLGEPGGPFLVARTPATDRWADRDDGFAAPQVDAPDKALQHVLVQAHMVDHAERQLGRAPTRPADWLTGGLGAFLADRALLRAGLMTPDEAVGRWVEQDAAPSDERARGLILFMKWDEDVRRKTAGKADLDDVVARMRDHYRQFAPGHGPDVVTGLVSAVWVTAGLDIRPDIARYGERAEAVPLMEELYGGCLLARVTVSPGFDAGFNADASFAARRVSGVRRRGPAWNSGLRDGMRIEAWKYQAGDMTRQIELTVRPANGRGRPRRIAYWPYGDADISRRRLQLDPDLAGERLTACGRRMGGL